MGHNCGAVTASMRRDFFRSVVLMSHPFNGSPKLPFNTANQVLNEQIAVTNGSGGEAPAAVSEIHEALAQGLVSHPITSAAKAALVGTRERW
ncbi:hypothetical protein N7490_003813 [Penicillium lividum]|nr:hypothetical protein N7490_003813 [Penicillium lividum]